MMILPMDSMERIYQWSFAAKIIQRNGGIFHIGPCSPHICEARPCLEVVLLVVYECPLALTFPEPW